MKPFCSLTKISRPNCFILFNQTLIIAFLAKNKCLLDSHKIVENYLQVFRPIYYLGPIV